MLSLWKSWPHQANCKELAKFERRFESSRKTQETEHHAHKTSSRRRVSSSSDSESAGLVVSHALSVRQWEGWVVDSGATSHMCSDHRQFVELHNMTKPLEVALGDGHTLNAAGVGVVMLDMVLPNGKTKTCKLRNVLYVPNLSYNLLSVSKLAEAGKVTKFGKTACHILNRDRKLTARATKVGSLYHLDCRNTCEQANVVNNMDQETKEQIWQQRFGHLGVRNLQKLATEKLVDGFNYDISKELQFCEPCSEGKHHRTSFPINHSKRSDKPLDLVHSDLCGKMNAKSLSGGEYFLTFIDDNTRYVWVYVLKRKDEVFERFLEWKAQVERKTGRKLKALRTDNEGEYTSTDFKAYLRTEGVRHELTVPKTPEQNGVAERMNRTLVETVRAMLADTKLPHKFWAEAVSTAVYLRNRSPSKAVKGMTPYEAWTGERPNVNHLRAFGCAVHAHTSKNERRKLDPKSRKCILLGYGTTTKGYRLYDPKRTRVFYSRDVLFNELERGIKETNPYGVKFLYVFTCGNYHMTLAGSKVSDFVTQ